jgi:hypothetical protein
VVVVVVVPAEGSAEEDRTGGVEGLREEEGL